MCDTFVALPSHTASGNLIFGKNSDREPNEAQAIVHFPACRPDSRMLRCTFIEIPQVAHAHQVILSKPFQMWGAEMGANEHGLVVGNEAVFTKVKFSRSNNGLTGMDLVRLSLERCESAKQAVQTITELVETYGQDACGGYRNKRFFYHNGFLIADTDSAWVLETAGRHWVAQRVDGFRSISNGLTVESDYDLISSGAIESALQNRWARSRDSFNFRSAYSDWLFTRGSHCRTRQGRSTQMGEARKGRFAISDAIAILTSHDRSSPQFRPSKSGSGSICMHATGITNPSQTTGSMIVELRASQPATVWLTGTSMPCLSVYLPFFFSQESHLPHALAPADWNSPGGQVDNSLWWQAERLHRQACRDYQRASAPFVEFQSKEQAELLKSEPPQIAAADDYQRQEFSRAAVGRVRSFLDEIEQSDRSAKPSAAGFLYRYYWSRANQQAGLT